MTAAVREGVWVPTRAHIRALAATVLLPVIAVVTHRPDLVVLSTPFVVIAVWSALSKPARTPLPSHRLGRVSVREGETTSLTVELADSQGARQVSLVLRERPFVETSPQSSSVSAVAPRGGDEPLRVSLGVRATRWGNHPIGPGLLGATSAWGSYRWGPVFIEERSLLTLPVAPVFDARAPTPHPQGLVGISRSARPGQGSEFDTIRPFQVGDRLRRIHWPSSLRSGQLNVRSTYADHDSQVLVVVDATNDLGRSDGIDGHASTLDATVRAAAAVAEHYVQRGDRVGMRVVGAANPSVSPPSTGRSHLRRILTKLAGIRPGGSYDEPDLNARYRIDPGTLVIMLSPLVSPATLQRALTLGRRGFTLIVIDTLPADLEHPDDAPAISLAWRIGLLERSVETASVVSAGIPIVPWRGPGSLDRVLRDIGRRAAAPRLARR